jgi:exodeoxyribonuclease III
MRILSWNIRHGGGTRHRAIVDTIVRHDPDVLVLTEYQPEPGESLCDELKKRGWKCAEATAPARKFNGVLVASRVPMTRRDPSADVANIADRWLEVEFPRQNFALAGLYLPTDKPELAEFWERIHQAADRRRDEHFLILGDLNTGYAPLDAEHYVDYRKTFSSERFFCGMAMRGFTDVWRYRNGPKLEYTWYSSSKANGGNGFRIDHAFASKLMLRRVRDCRYSHAEREGRASDHSSMLLQVH